MPPKFVTRQREALEGLYLLHDVAQAVVIDALHELSRAVGREERPGHDAAPRHVLSQHRSDEGHR